MEDTFLPGDFLFVFKPVYGIVIPFSTVKIPERVYPRRQETVVFQFPYEPKDYIKRVIAMEGDTVEIINKKVYVNGRPLNEPYVTFKDRRIIEWPYEIPPGEFQRIWESGGFMGTEWVRDNFGPVVVPEGGSEEAQREVRTTVSHSLELVGASGYLLNKTAVDLKAG